ncbi:hypothetical protein [Paenibacillus sp. Z6-24]
MMITAFGIGKERTIRETSGKRYPSKRTAADSPAQTRNGEKS